MDPVAPRDLEAGMRANFPRMLKERRAEFGLSQADVAREANVPRKMMNKYESGVCLPSIWNWPSLCSVLCWNMEDVMEAMANGGETG